MILIVSESGDQSTNEVIEWLILCKREYIRVNENDIIKIHNIDICNSIIPCITFSINDNEPINTDEVTAYWFRRGLFNFFGVGENIQIKNKGIEHQIKANLKTEISRLGDLFQSVLETKNKIGSFYTADNNKITHLSIAKSVDLDVPKSIICTSMYSLKQFYSEHPKGVITKPISDTLSLTDNSKCYNLYTNVINMDDLKTFPNSFHPTLVQEKIEKKFEIRVFFLKNKFYSMAIFSQKDDKTKIDFRRYNRQSQNYRIPFNLPIKIRNRLKKLMRLINLDCGSIDILYSLSGKYYFLEVNPVGQFGMVSYPCNYQLDKKIAYELIKKNGKKNKIQIYK
ncbi:MAG TPA: grasp-with-spasm system ATP-grasp peptide maturase [Bacteroidia bacterium]|jgi:ATP-GRASP peptide maturase of grasp-with-spasm system|nr:grasp-with-spasm system ATP-grasp peptide maturase [Bacteroidia bacterium]